ncbi:MAG: hypothetical protein QOD53_1995 [Thermoleophilaceae bacterium]|nr:hypothetical protein [Thermoleophilaceae bacterium]
MTTFFLDLWQDLRAKRLWPVAVALLAATVAVPALLFKPVSETPPAVGAAHDSGAKLPVVALDASSVANSHLNVFKEKNPFKALGGASGAPLAGSSAPTLGNAVAGAVSSANKSGASAAGSAGSSSSSSGSSTGGTAPVGPDGKTVTPGVHFFTYTADVRFGKLGSEKTYKSVRELDVLPDGAHPVISFYGVKNGKTAVFFLPDPAFRADGEGKCMPTPDNCRFLYLTQDDAHNQATLSSQNGQIEYSLKLTGLHVKSLSETAAKGDTTPEKGTPSSKRLGKVKNKAERKAIATLLTLPALGIGQP